MQTTATSQSPSACMIQHQGLSLNDVLILSIFCFCPSLSGGSQSTWALGLHTEWAIWSNAKYMVTWSGSLNQLESLYDSKQILDACHLNFAHMFTISALSDEPMPWLTIWLTTSTSIIASTFL